MSRRPVGIVIDVVLSAAAVAVLLSIVYINLPERAPAPAPVECIEWTAWQQIQKDAGKVGEVEWCSQYGESNDQ